MFRKLTVLIMCLVFLTITSSVFAEDVYITKQGKKYHKENCRFIANRDTQEIGLEDANAKGLTPCSKCFGDTEEVTKSKSNRKTDKNEDLVYVTKGGKKYHKPECSLIKNKNTTGIPIVEAETKNLTPCSKCSSDQQVKAK
ncbi:MAG: hypothetical protein ABH954_02955 [Candidatus Omnitrophota bacterium]